ncbi:MAG TPA: hypothetical protein VFR67_06180 [Pilimelia sp.]|nr:hypothetical protein [Pilimelia sp.]
MTQHHTTATTRAADLTGDIAQLTQPIHIAAQGRIHTLPCLLDQLRDACTPSGGTTGAGIRTPPGSRPPVRLDAVDALAEVYAGISMWHARLRLPSPPRDQDWQLSVLRTLADTAPTLEPARADWLAIEVHDWWRLAATASGWTPDQLRRLR